MTTIPRLFVALLCAQALHSFEEYRARLWEVFGPARAVSGLLTSDLRTGFVIANLALLGFGFWCYAARVRPNHRSARAWIWFWIVVEGVNGIGHLALAALRGGYFPGALTAPLLLGFSIALAVKVRQPGSQGVGEPGSRSGEE